MSEILSRQAIGRVAKLGDLYDIRTEQITGSSAFSSQLPLNLINTQEHQPHTEYLIEKSNTLKEKLEKLDIEEELQLSIIGGLVKLEGSGKYFSLEQANSISIKYSLISKIKTKSQSYDLTNKQVKKLISNKSLKDQTMATHVITEIQYGAIMAVSFEFLNKNRLRKEEAEFKLDQFFNKALLLAEGKAGSIEIDDEFRDDIKTSLMTDTIGLNELAFTIEDLLIKIKSLPSVVKENKDVPISFKMIPIESFIEKKIKKQIVPIINDFSYQEVLIEFDDFLKKKLELDHLANRIELLKAIIPSTIYEEISNKMKNVKIEESQFREELKKEINKSYLNKQAVELPDGKKYDGDFLDGDRTGRGILTTPSGDRYEADFINGEITGYGSYLSASKESYKGDFLNGKAHGYGTRCFLNGNKYTGDFLRGGMNGKGVMLFANGDKYEGQFRGSKMNGNGIYYFHNGNKYYGEFLDDKLSGKGKMQYIIGESYEGDFLNGEKHGVGTYYYLNGDSYLGIWKNDQKCGEGYKTKRNGKYIRQNWQNGHNTRKFSRRLAHSFMCS